MNKTISSLILAILAVDAMIDLAFLNSLNIKSEDEDTDKHPLIGRRYKVQDNSYIKDIETGIENGIGLYGREVIIVSDPYVDEVKGWFGNEPRENLFVDVFSTDSARKYRVLFNEGWLIDEE